MTDEPNPPGMIGPCSSERGLPVVAENPAEHAADFSRRYADDLEIVVGQAMLDLGLSNDKMGMHDLDRGGEHHTFFPEKETVGSVSHLGQIALDSGIMNPAAMDRPYGETYGSIWLRSRLRPRVEAAIAHEKVEKECQNHELALIAGAKTDLPISFEAREILRAMEAGWRGHSR